MEKFFTYHSSSFPGAIGKIENDIHHEFQYYGLTWVVHHTRNSMLIELPEFTVSEKESGCALPGNSDTIENATRYAVEFMKSKGEETVKKAVDRMVQHVKSRKLV